MKRQQVLRHLLFFFFLFLLIFPVLTLLAYIPLTALDWDPFLGVVLQGALIQSILSTALTLFIGFSGAFGLLFLKDRLKKSLFQVFVFSIIAPSFLPPIMVVVLASKGLGHFLTGLWGVVFLHVIMNVGLVSYLFFRIIVDKAHLWLRDSYIMGVPTSRFIIKGLIPEIKADVFSMSFYFFLLYFFSFSVPFLVGGARYGGVEVFIYEKVLFYSQWSQALQYSLALFLVFFILSRWVGSSSHEAWKKTSSQSLVKKYLAGGAFLLGPVVPLLLLCLGFFQSLFRTLQAGNEIPLGASMQMTLLIGLGVGVLCFAFLSLITFCFLGSRWSRVLLSWIHPGWVVVGFAFLLLSSDGGIVRILSLVFALSLLYFPFLFRLNFSKNLEDLNTQVRVTQNMPVSWWHVFSRVLFPQMLPKICFLSGLAGIWACGDFALCEILLDPTHTSSLALEMKHLISNYRIEKALLLLPSLLCCCVLVFFVFQGLYYVSGKKALS